MTEISYHSSNTSSQELPVTDVKQHEKNDVSDSYSDGFESASSKELSRASGASSSSGRGNKGPKGVCETAHLRQNNLEKSKGSMSSRSGSTNGKHETSGNSENAHTPLTKDRDHDKEAPKSASKMSSISREDNCSRSTTGRIDILIQRLKAKHHTLQAGEGKEGAPSLLSKRSQWESTGVDYGGEPMSVNTTEDLSQLLAQNDKLRMQVLENGRAEKYPSGAKRNVRNGKDSFSYGRLQLRKTTAAIQWALHREQVRQELRGEREYLILLRNQLRNKVLSKKRLHVYFSLIEDCKADIARLTEEKRALSLAILHNEKVLINNEAGQASEMVKKRLKEEMRAETVLAQRSFEKAQREAMEAMKMCQDAEVRVQQLEQQLELANKKQEEATEDDNLELRGLIEENQRKVQEIQQLRRELRQLRSGKPNAARHGSKKGSTKDADKEGANLVKRIHQLRKELNKLSVSVNQQKAHEELKQSEAPLLNRVRHTDYSKEDSAKKRHVGGADASPGLAEGEKRRELVLEEGTTRRAPNSWSMSAANTLSEPKGDSIERAIDELRHRVEQGQARVKTMPAEQRSFVPSTDGATKLGTDHAFLCMGVHSSHDKPREPSFLQDENAPVLEAKHQAELNAPVTGEGARG
ncbi:hypothetical protein TRSC58_01698 [Trypanosoma rangeli SC58]|uniref:Lebercilin domain-containing protein n=1 Tax=Trypanosoma rangeli SC58 TaxID=429131 RepID=A0A061J5A0_TRYRA|nr:hypothetical protein TRSC58_01698 [Trypanosoma rangeli SC58]